MPHYPGGPGPIPATLGNLTTLTIDNHTGLCLANDFLLTSIFATESGLSVCTAGFTLDFTHFANGEGITSDLLLVNVGTHPVRPALYFYDKEGHLIAAESVVDVLGDLVVREDGALSVQTEMEPLGELTIATHGRGDLVTGSVKVISSGPVTGSCTCRGGRGGASQPAALHNLGEEAMRAGSPVHQRDVHRGRYIQLRGVGALQHARGGTIHRSGGGTRCRQPHLHDLAGGERGDFPGINRACEKERFCNPPAPDGLSRV